MRSIMFIKLISVCCLVFAAVLTASAIDAGDEMPELKVSKWLMNGPVKIEFDPNDKAVERKIYTYIFWGSWSNPSRDVLPLLTLLQKKYQAEKLKIILISREDEETVSKFLEKNSIGGCAMALDDKSISTLSYMGQDRMFPKAFIIGNGSQILWSGEPVDLPGFYEQFYAGRFSFSRQKEKTAIALELKVALQQQNSDLIRKLSDDILKLDPEDGFALRSRLFTCENEGNIGEAFQLLNKLLKKAPSAKLYFIKLDLIARYPDLSNDLLPVAKECLEKFGNNTEELNNLAWLLIERFPYTPGTLEIATAAAQRAEVLITKSGDTLQQAATFNTLALVYYKSGLLSLAVANQQKALDASKDNPAATKSGTMALEYYQRALKLQEKGNAGGR